MSPRVQRIRQAFVASASLRPMAQQLLQERTPQAYAGVRPMPSGIRRKMPVHWLGWPLDTRTFSITITRRLSIR